MDTNDVYKLAVQSALAMAARELMRVEHEEDQQVDTIDIQLRSDGGIDVMVYSLGGGMDGYSL